MPVDSKIATQLLRVARDPRSGRPPGRRDLDVCLRAALFCDLALAGVVRSERGSPRCTDASAVADDLLLRSIAAAVARRPDVSWRRWFTHIGPDRDALIRQLLDDGIWTQSPDSARRFVDVDPDGVRAQVAELTAVRQFARGPRSPREAVLSFLADVLAGGRVKAIAQRWDGVLPSALPTTGAGSSDLAATILDCLNAANTARRPRRLFLH